MEYEDHDTSGMKFSLVKFLAMPNPVPKGSINDPGYSFKSSKHLNVIGTKIGAAKELIKINKRFSSNELELLSRPENEEEKCTGAHYLTSEGYIFTIDELIQINNPANAMGQTPAHLMALRKNMFSIENLLALKNPVDCDGQSIASIMIENGASFSSPEIMQLMKVSLKELFIEARQIEVMGITIDNGDLLEF